MRTEPPSATALRARWDESWSRLRILALAVALAAVCGYIVSAPAAAHYRLPLAAVTVLAVLLCVPPNVFLIGAFLFFATFQVVADRSYSFGPANFYLSDLSLGVIVLRGLAPIARAPGERRLGRFTLGAFGAWAILMASAMYRGLERGAPYDTVFRYSLPLFYWPILYWGFSRILRERGADRGTVFRGTVITITVLIAYMFAMRAIHHPFESSMSTSGSLARVSSFGGEVFRRDYGFYSAYTLYPILALIGIARALYDVRRRRAWFWLSVIAIVATLTTLIRGTNYGLALGIVVVLLVSDAPRMLRGQWSVVSPRVRIALAIGLTLAVAGILVVLLSPRFAHVVAERSIPHFVHQSMGAQANAKFRFDALRASMRVADHHVFGVGVLAPYQMPQYGIDPGFFVDAGPTRVFVFIGWPGVIAAGLLLLGVIVDSARRRSDEPWFHAALAGILVLLVADAMSSAGIFGLDYVIGTAALLIALRFTAAAPSRLRSA